MSPFTNNLFFTLLFFIEEIFAQLSYFLNLKEMWQGYLINVYLKLEPHQLTGGGGKKRVSYQGIIHLDKYLVKQSQDMGVREI